MPISLICTSFRCGGKAEYLEKTQVGMGRMYKLHTVALPGNQFCFLINVNETMLNKMALFDDLLYFKIAIIKYVQQFKGKQELKKKKNGNYYKATKCKF